MSKGFTVERTDTAQNDKRQQESSKTINQRDEERQSPRLREYLDYGSIKRVWAEYKEK